jgi:hypothetical protein
MQALVGVGVGAGLSRNAVGAGLGGDETLGCASYGKEFRDSESHVLQNNCQWNIDRRLELKPSEGWHQRSMSFL